MHRIMTPTHGFVKSHIALAKAVAAYPNGIVLVGVPPGRPKLRHKPAPPVVNLQEWYPYHSGFPVSDWGEMPTCEGYILQNRFWGFQGTRRPDWFRRRSLIRQAQAHNPRFIFLVLMPKPGPNVHKKDTEALTEVICEMCAQRHSKPRCPHCGHKPNRTKRDR